MKQLFEPFILFRPCRLKNASSCRVMPNRVNPKPHAAASGLFIAATIFLSMHNDGLLSLTRVATHSAWPTHKYSSTLSAGTSQPFLRRKFMALRTEFGLALKNLARVVWM